MEDEPVEPYLCIDGPLKGQYVAQPGVTFLAVAEAMPVPVKYDPSAAPVNKTVPTIRYHLWYAPRGMKVWSVGAPK